MELERLLEKKSRRIFYNVDFLEVIKKSFEVYLKTSSRSNEKLVVLHGFISDYLQNQLGYDYEIKSLGFNDGHESSAPGRYMDKKVDITVIKDGIIIAGLAVKFVMSNYSQNSNNYFENMLGETANIRCNNIPYFQIFIIPDKIPYYDKDKRITRWEEISVHNLEKYINLSRDNVDVYMHTPNKTFIGIVHIDDCPDSISNFQLYKQYYLTHQFDIKFSNNTFNFGPSVVYNDFASFISKIVHYILSI